MKLEWTREYYGVRHLKGIIKAYQVTMARYVEDSDEGQVYIIYKRGANPFTPLQEFRGTIVECHRKAHRWVAQYGLIDFEKAIKWDPEKLTEEEHSEDFENIAGIDPFCYCSSSQEFCTLVLTKMRNFCHARGMKLEPLIKASKVEFKKQKKERSAWRGI